MGMARSYQWIRPMTVKPILKSELFSDLLVKVAVIEADIDDPRIYKGILTIPGTDFQYKFNVYEPENIDDAESKATEIIYEQIEEWIDMCKAISGGLPEFRAMNYA